jgi:hypothetical protein
MKAQELPEVRALERFELRAFEIEAAVFLTLIGGCAAWFFGG